MFIQILDCTMCNLTIYNLNAVKELKLNNKSDGISRLNTKSNKMNIIINLGQNGSDK